VGRVRRGCHEDATRKLYEKTAPVEFQLEGGAARRVVRLRRSAKLPVTADCWTIDIYWLIASWPYSFARWYVCRLVKPITPFNRLMLSSPLHHHSLLCRSFISRLHCWSESQFLSTSFPVHAIDATWPRRFQTNRKSIMFNSISSICCGSVVQQDLLHTLLHNISIRKKNRM